MEKNASARRLRLATWHLYGIAMFRFYVFYAANFSQTQMSHNSPVFIYSFCGRRSTSTMTNLQQQVSQRKADSQNAKSQPGGQWPRYKNIYKTYVQDWWLTEILSLIIGFISIIGLCVLLRTYDGKPTSQSNGFFGVNISLNTLVSIVSALGRAALLVSVAECVSQLKWLWYLNHDRPLADLDVFDEASRGAWGGFKLLWRINVRYASLLPSHYVGRDSCIV